MHYLILGATGALGQNICREALSMGHIITALVRTPSKFAQDISNHKSLILKTGDVLDLTVVSSLFSTTTFDAVLIALGGGGIMARDYVRSIGTRNVIQAMDDKGMYTSVNSLGGPRLIICSTMGASESKEWIPSFIYWMLKHPIADTDEQEKLVKTSRIPFVIARPTGLTNQPKDGSVRETHQGPVPTNTVTRNDVAIWMLKQVESNLNLGKAIGLCKPA
jgi:nucleoside-diphosphate-sugar epimerase